MNTNRVTVGLVTFLAVACCLTLDGFASPAAAHHIVVTTLTDTADPPLPILIHFRPCVADILVSTASEYRMGLRS